MLHTPTLHLHGHLFLQEGEAEARSRNILRGPPSARNRGAPVEFPPLGHACCDDDLGCCPGCCAVCCPVCCDAGMARHGARHERSAGASTGGARGGTAGASGGTVPPVPRRTQPVPSPGAPVAAATA